LGTLARFVDLDTKIKEMDAELKELKRERETLEDPLVEGLIEAGIQNMNVNGKTVYIRTQLWASAKDIVDDSGEVVAKDWTSALEAVRSTGHGDLVETRINSQRLSALVRELDETEDGIPEILRDNLNISEQIKLVVRR
jgi:hypothetical protein